MLNDGILWILKIHSAQTSKFLLTASYEKISESEMGYVQQKGNRAKHTSTTQVLQLLFRLRERQKINWKRKKKRKKKDVLERANYAWAFTHINQLLVASYYYGQHFLCCLVIIAQLHEWGMGNGQAFFFWNFCKHFLTISKWLHWIICEYSYCESETIYTHSHKLISLKSFVLLSKYQVLLSELCKHFCCIWMHSLFKKHI